MRPFPHRAALQTLEFSRRVITMGACLGAVVVGSDRELSADTYAVGTVISAGKTRPPAPTHVEPPAAEGAGASAPPGPERIALHYFSPEYRGSLPVLGGASAATGPPQDTKQRVRRAKVAGIAEMSHSPMPHAAVEALARAFSAQPEPGSAAPAAAAAARAAAERSLGFAHGLSWHDPAAGDNPLPEAVVMALGPHGAAAAVAAEASALLARFPPGRPQAETAADASARAPKPA